VAAGAQTREPYTYSSEIYDASQVSPATEQEVLDFLAQDTTDNNLWVSERYECGHFAADVWWNAYKQRLEACMVWVKRWKLGKEQLHWVVKFHVGNETQNYWLWVEPSSDEKATTQSRTPFTEKKLSISAKPGGKRKVSTRSRLVLSTRYISRLV